jgi:cyclophilin family peptidyl-prolyl cis-trans isomerase/HEAT repeat protein
LTTHVQIVKAEDARRYDSVVENLMKSPDASVRKRAVLAAGRIGDEAAIAILSKLLESDGSTDVRAMAAFALGEIESIKGADVILKTLNDSNAPDAIRARAVEAAGKIAAANASDERAKLLAAAVSNSLDLEFKKSSAPSTSVIRLGLTAVLRARPAGADEGVRRYLSFTDPNIVADALNTLTRLRAKNANRDARDLLSTNVHAVVRANAARLLGAAEDKEAFDVLLKAAVEDRDSRVRVSAIRSLTALKDLGAADKLLVRGEKLLADYKRPKFANPVQKNELLEIATAVGRLLAGSGNTRAFDLLTEFAKLDKYVSPETETAIVRIDPKRYDDYSQRKELRLKRTWKALSATSQAFTTVPDLDNSEANKAFKAQVISEVRQAMDRIGELKPAEQPVKGMPDLLRTYAAFKPDDAYETLRGYLSNDDVFIRATTAELLAAQPAPRGTVTALERAFTKAVSTDKHDNDAQLAMLDAIAKIDKAAAVDTLYAALDAPDYLVRKKVFELLDDAELLKKYPGAAAVAMNARAQKKHQVLPYDPKTGTKLGQVLNTDADYRRAVSRKNGSVKAVLSTEKGTFTIDLFPEDAPLTVDNFVKLARSGYFNGLEVHRVVPNFVMQDGDPRGDGNGGPGWSIRCEINMVPYERGAVGMALSGKDTGGSQWFVTHSPQPHLDGGYTVLGKVNETGMKVVDNIVRGDKIIGIKIVGDMPQRTQSAPRKSR